MVVILIIVCICGLCWVFGVALFVGFWFGVFWESACFWFWVLSSWLGDLSVVGCG